MKMQKEWSSFRLTLLLYTLVFIMPLTFYFVYTSFNSAQNDTKVIHQIGWIEGVSESINTSSAYTLKQPMVQNIDAALQDISIWVRQNNNSKFYLGGETLSKDFSNVMTCWSKYKQKSSYNIHDTKCSHQIKNLTVIIENMVYLKQKNLVNMFYWNLAIAMLITLLLIYFVRVYIHKQMKKHSIHDHETHLFNQKYFLSELHSTFSGSIRHGNPLSLLSVSLNGFTEKTYDKKTKNNLMKELGELFTSVTRNSDISCRYDENHFAVLLPLTNREHALILEDRLREALENHDFKVAPEMKFSFVTTEANAEETEEAFIARTL